MNRRNAIRAAIVAGLAPTAAIPKSREDEKRELLLKAASLDLSADETHEIAMLVMAVSHGRVVGNQPAPTLADLRGGMPIAEVYERVTARTHEALYGPGGRYWKGFAS